jgi:hypothetical protein
MIPSELIKAVVSGQFCTGTRKGKDGGRAISVPWWYGTV